ncbi:major facilitator superfamily MFS_1 [Carnobacterium sp. 17-4]|uniref:MFS transporter n=1 Tax=Carnobacterium sp. (strain 17-4) TaxID=208596 RepID=UPI00020589BC|nr:MFS transporter [Carnobacterium sp. 17-4]AEB28874.1 major facilitator superfamily MFS_1 [Carnobacterium sp. 17-4]
MKLLADKNFLSLFMGRLTTNAGDSIYYITTTWLAAEITNDPFYVGLTSAVILIPKGLQFLWGPLVDRWNIKPVLIMTQLIQAVLILLIPILYYMNLLTIYNLLPIVFLAAIIAELGYPVQLKALPAMLPKNKLLQGNSLLAIANQTADIVMNALSGILLAILGIVTLYLVDSIMFTLAALLFSLIKLKKAPLEAVKVEKLNLKNYGLEMKIGLKVVFNSMIWVFLIANVVINFCLGVMYAILPIYANSLGGEEKYGYILTAISIGTVLGSLISTKLNKVPIGLFISSSFIVAFILWGIAPFMSFYFFLLLFTLCWIPIGSANIILGSVMQSVLPLTIIGRTNSVMSSFGAIAMPIGSLIGGLLVRYFESNLVLSIAAIGFLVVGLTWLFNKKLRNLPNSETISYKDFNIPKEFIEL